MARRNRISVVAKSPWYQNIDVTQRHRIIHEDYHQVIHVLRQWHKEYIEDHDNPEEAIMISMTRVQVPGYANWNVTFVPRTEFEPLWRNRLGPHRESARPSRDGDILVIHVDEAYTEASARLKWIAYHIPKSLVLRKRRRKRKRAFKPFVGHHDWVIDDALHSVETLLEDIEVLEDDFDNLMRSHRALARRIDRQSWKGIERLIDKGRRYAYEKAVDWMDTLASSYESRDAEARFESRVHDLLDEHSRKTTFVALVEDQLLDVGDEDELTPQVPHHIVANLAEPRAEVHLH